MTTERERKAAEYRQQAEDCKKKGDMAGHRIYKSLAFAAAYGRRVKLKDLTSPKPPLDTP